jgi:nicotinate phosphoribosyltransferase
MSTALVTDLYQVSMALVYLAERMTRPATFSLFARHLPPNRGFLVAAGLESALGYLEDFRVTDEDVTDLAATTGRSVEELEALRGLRFTGDVWAVPEGRVAFAGEPLLEVTAPLPEAQLVETYLLNQVSHQTAQASKAARCVLAAGGVPVIDFGLRRCHGVEAAAHAARAGGIAGFAATSNVAAATEYGLTATGTMAHSFIEAFGDERRAFEAFADLARGPVTLLVDTYDTPTGVRTAADVLRGLGTTRPTGVRLDSGDLAELAGVARRLLDEAGLTEARIVVSGGLDEYDITDLLTAGAPVDAFAVGTKVGTCADAPYLDTAYKLVEYDGRPVMKLSTGKVTWPGPKQVFRGDRLDDVIGTRDEAAPAATEPLLVPVMTGGRRVAPAPGPRAAVSRARERLANDLAALPSAARAIRGPAPPEPQRSATLVALTEELTARLRAGRAGR